MNIIFKSLDPNAAASATSVSVVQKTSVNAADMRPEKVVVIGQYQDGKTVNTNEIYLAAGNPDDVGIAFGFGSPLHRMALKLFPRANNGCKVETYFIPIAAPANAEAQVTELSATVGEDGVKKTFTGYIRINNMPFEAAADIAGKIATNAQNNPAKDPRGIDLNSFEKDFIAFDVQKGAKEEDVINIIKDILDEELDIPFKVDKTTTNDKPVLNFTAKWKGSDSDFYVDIVDINEKEITTEEYGINLNLKETTAASGLGSITDKTFDVLTEEMGITRLIMQYSDDATLNNAKNYFDAWHDGLIAQYVLCYSAIKAPESETVKGTYDLQKLIAKGNKRRDDYVNIQIAGDYGDLRPLKYKERNLLLKAGFSNIVLKSDGHYQVQDICTFYHPVGKKNPLFKFDRNVCVIGNSCFDFINYFKNADEWKSFIIVAQKDKTQNAAARTLKDIKAAVNSRISLQGKAGLIADYDLAQKRTIVEIDSNNPDRININPDFELTGVGRIIDITNFVSFYWR